MALPPAKNRSKRAYELYQRAQEVYTDLGADVIEEDDFSEWADKVILQIPGAKHSRLDKKEDG